MNSLFASRHVSSGHPALFLPDIVRLVLQQLHNDALSLYAAVRVSRMWFACGVSTLWREPYAGAFARVASPRRRQFYADKTETLEEVPAEVLAGGLQLPRLQRLLLMRSAPHGPLDDLARMLRMVQPTLVELNCDLTRAVMRCLSRQRHGRLSSLSIRNRIYSDDPATFESVIDWMGQRPLMPLRRVFIQNLPYTDACIADRAFCLFACLPNLQDVRLCGYTPSMRLAGVVKAQSDADNGADGSRDKPFPHLQHLECCVEVEAVPTLVAMLPVVTELSLLIVGVQPVLPAMAALKQLLSLDICFCSARRYQSYPRMYRYHSALQREVLFGDGDGEVCADLVGLLGALRALEVLKLSCPMSASFELLVHIGRSCLQLQILELMSSVSLGAVVEHGGGDVLFPRLQDLVVKSLVAPSHLGPGDIDARAEAQRLAPLLREQAPLLEDVHEVVRSSHSRRWGTYLWRAVQEYDRRNDDESS